MDNSQLQLTTGCRLFWGARSSALTGTEIPDENVRAGIKYSYLTYRDNWMHELEQMQQQGPGSFPRVEVAPYLRH